MLQLNNEKAGIPTLCYILVTTTKKTKEFPAMTTITQDMYYRLSLFNYAEKYGVSRAAIKYKTNRQYIYRWKRRFDGSVESLHDRSGRPYYHPNQHTPSEIKHISDMRRRIHMMALLFSGSNLCNTVTPAPSPAYTISCAGRTLSL